jgi:hypothetical protein
LISVALLIGLVLGGALGTIAMAFLASAAYDRGYADAWRQRREWRTELAQRRVAHPTTRRAA